MYENQFNYLTFGGTAYAGVETWSVGLKLSRTIETTSSIQAIALSCAPLVETYWRDVNAVFLSTHTLEFCKVAAVDTDGRYLPGESVYEHLYLPPIAGPRVVTVGSNQSLPQQSLCISLRTAVTRGYAAKGRIYPPPQYVQLGLDGSANAVASYATPVKTLINSINAATGTGVVVIASKGKGVRNPSSTGKPRYTYPTPGAEHAVTAVSVGRVVDTQRRRRRQLNEAPTLIAL